MNSRALHLSDVARQLRMPMARLRTMLDAGNWPPGVEAVELTPGGHRRVMYRPAPPVVFCTAASLAPSSPPSAASWHRPWSRVVDDDKARRVAILAAQLNAQLVVMSYLYRDPHLYSAAMRHAGCPCEVISYSTVVEAVIREWLEDERLAGWPRTAYTVTPELELSEVKDA